jgi:hypothetical protein
MRYAYVAAVLLGCGASPKPATPAGLPPGEAPPTSTVDPMAPPQMDPGGTAPVIPEKGGPSAATTNPTALPVVLASNPAPAAPTTQPGTTAPPQQDVGSPVMKRGKIEVSGTGLDQATATRFLNKYTASFLLCYQHATPAVQKTGGATTLTFKVGNDGKVTNADTSGGLDRSVDDCLTGVVSGIEFPKAKNLSVNVSYPLTFEWK